MVKELQVGVVTRTHGVQGEVKVFVTSDDPKRFETLSKVIFVKGAERKTLQVEKVRYFKNQAILKFRESKTADDAALLVRGELLIPREEALPLSENEYFIGDLIGCHVQLEDGTAFGTLTDVLATGANDVYEVTTEEGSKVLIPAIRQCILAVDPENALVTVHLLPGLV